MYLIVIYKKKVKLQEIQTVKKEMFIKENSIVIFLVC